MAGTYTYPGVYIEELSSGVRTITGVSTSVTAFLGRTARGPTDKPRTVTSFAEFELLYGGLNINCPISYAVRDFYLNGGSVAVIARLTKGASSSTAHFPTPDAGEIYLSLEAANEGIWGDQLSAAVDHKTVNPDNVDLFNLTILVGDIVVEVFRNVSRDSASPRYVESVLAQSSLLARVTAVGDLRPAETKVDFTDGKDGDSLELADYEGKENDRTGIYMLDNVDLVNLLCIPPDDQAGDVDEGVVALAAKYCENRRAFLIVDSLSTWNSVNDAVQGMDTNDDTVPHLGTTSLNSAVYFPRLKKANPLKEGLVESFPACGAVAGVYARTDATRGVWKAPAGQEAVLVGVPELAVELTDGNIGLLNPVGLNCLRPMTGVGRVVYGARTLQGSDRLASEWKYIPVRRLTLFIEESLYRGTQWAVFEPNDEPLWAQLRLNIGAFMNNLFRQGAFQGSTPKDAYFVKVDRETTTQNDINLGIVNILVGFAPLKPAEFVVIKIQQMAGQLEV